MEAIKIIEYRYPNIKIFNPKEDTMWEACSAFFKSGEYYHSIEIESDDIEVLYMIANVFTINKINANLSLIPDLEIFSIRDVTEQIVSLIVNEVENFTNSLCESSKEEMEDLTIFIYNNLVTVDDILDKMNAKGIKSLNERDFCVLNNQMCYKEK